MNKKELLFEAVQDATLLDTDFMGYIFSQNPSIIEDIIKIVMRETEGIDDIEIDLESVQIENKLINLIGHSIIGDITTKSFTNISFMIEFQKNKDKFNPKRARYYTSMNDSVNLDKGEDYSYLDDLYIIVFVKGDITGHELAVGNYTMMEKEHHLILETGINYIIVNVDAENWPDKFNGIKEIAQDISETNPEKIHMESLRNEYLKIKNTEEPKMYEGTVFEKYYQARFQEDLEEFNQKKQQFEESERQFKKTEQQLKEEKQRSKETEQQLKESKQEIEKLRKLLQENRILIPE